MIDITPDRLSASAATAQISAGALAVATLAPCITVAGAAL
jgi:hypothetical protein